MWNDGQMCHPKWQKQHLPFVGSGAIVLLLSLSVRAQELSRIEGEDLTPKGTGGLSDTGLNQPTSRSRPPLPHPLSGVTTILEADVVAARNTYDDTLGPRTEIVLDNIVAHAGKVPKEKTLSQFGGPVPDGRYFWSDDIPVLYPGGRYILFLSNQEWFYSPFCALLAYRVETIGTRKIVLGPSGHPILGFDARMAHFGATEVVAMDLHRTEPLYEVRHDPALDVMSIPDLDAALSSVDFVRRVIDVAEKMGAHFGEANVRPRPRQMWNLEKTSAGIAQ